MSKRFQKIRRSFFREYEEKKRLRDVFISEGFINPETGKLTSLGVKKLGSYKKLARKERGLLRKKPRLSRLEYLAYGFAREEAGASIPEASRFAKILAKKVKKKELIEEEKKRALNEISRILREMDKRQIKRPISPDSVKGLPLKALTGYREMLENEVIYHETRRRVAKQQEEMKKKGMHVKPIPRFKVIQEKIFRPPVTRGLKEILDLEIEQEQRLMEVKAAEERVKKEIEKLRKKVKKRPKKRKIKKGKK